MLTLIEAPEAVPLSLAELRAETRLDDADSADDARLAGYLRSAVAQLDGKDGWLGRCLIAQTWQLTCDDFAPVIRLPLPPLIEVVSIAYIDPDGAEQTLASNVYRVVGADPALLMPVYGQSWPVTRHEVGAVRITFRAGYGDWNAVPEDIRHAIALKVAAAYDSCEHAWIDSMILRYRAW